MDSSITIESMNGFRNEIKNIIELKKQIELEVANLRDEISKIDRLSNKIT